MRDDAQFDHLYDDVANLAQKVATPPPGDCPYTLFLGAGASVSSGIRPVQSLIEQWCHELFRAAAPWESFSDWVEGSYKEWLERQKMGRVRESEYAILFSRFHKTRRARQVFIEREIDGRTPNFGYLYLAGLVSGHRINRILTTNFDDLINDALARFYDIKPIVCAFDSAIRSIRFDSLRPKVLKLHGDFLFDNIKNVGDEVVRLDANMEEKFLQTCKEGGLIVVGYGGDDESVMGPLQTMVRSADYLKMGLHWCIHHPKPGKPEIPPKLRHLLDNYSDRITLYRIDGFDQLMYEMFVQCKCEHPEAFVNPGRKNVFKEFKNTVKSYWESYELSLGMNEHLELYLEHSNKKEFDPELELEQADVKHRKANHCYYDMKSASRALHLYDECRKQCEGILASLRENDEGFSLLRFRTYKRLTGAYHGLLCCEQELGRTWKHHFESVLEAATIAHRFVCDYDGSLGLANKELRIPSFNAVAAYCGRARKEPLVEADLQSARAWFQRMIALDEQGDDQRLLKKEPGWDDLDAQWKAFDSPALADISVQLGYGEVNLTEVSNGGPPLDFLKQLHQPKEETAQTASDAPQSPPPA